MTVAILANRFKPAEHLRTAYHVTPRIGDTPESLLDPKYWVHVSRVLRGGDRIEVLAETREWFAEAIVVDAGVWGAKIAYVVGPVRLTNDAEVELPDELEIKWAGPAVKFRVIRKVDNLVLKDGCQTKEEAAAWIRNHRTAMAA